MGHGPARIRLERERLDDPTLAEVAGHHPDLTLLGKVMGGGLPIAAFGGRADVMESVLGIEVEPAQRVSHAGTFVGHPLAMASGAAVIRELRRTNPYPALNAAGEELRSDLREIADSAGVDVQVTGFASFFQLHFTNTPVRNVRDTLAADGARWRNFCFEMTRRLPLAVPAHACTARSTQSSPPPGWPLAVLG